MMMSDSSVSQMSASPLHACEQDVFHTSQQGACQAQNITRGVLPCPDPVRTQSDVVAHGKVARTILVAWYQRVNVADEPVKADVV